MNDLRLLQYKPKDPLEAFNNYQWEVSRDVEIAQLAIEKRITLDQARSLYSSIHGNY